jgi:hypothetical protein
MKHIKKFNESRSLFGTIENSIEDLCNGRLAFLLDEGYEVKYHVEDKIFFNRDFIIDIGLIADKNCANKYKFYRYDDNGSVINKTYRKFSWSDIKDYVIPLLQQLNKDYNIEVEIYGMQKGDYIPHYKNYDINWIISDSPSKFFAVNSIRWIKIKIRYKFYM